MNKSPKNAGTRQGNIYFNGSTYHQQLKETSKKDLTLLCPLNVAGNTSHFYKLQEFTRELINYTFNMGHKNIAIVALNEPFEYLNLDSYYGSCLSIRNGILESKRPDIPIILGNEKIRTTRERNYYDSMMIEYRWKMLKNIYIGFQSLGTTTSRMDEYFKKAKNNNWKMIDVEFGDGRRKIDYHYDSQQCLNTLKNKFNLEILFNIEGCFLVFPYQKQNGLFAQISFNFINDNLSVIKKRKSWEIKDYILKNWKPMKEDGMKIAEYYKKGDFGDGCIDWIQAQLKYQGYLPTTFTGFGTFNIETEDAVKEWQQDNGLTVTGIITKYHIFTMGEQSPKGADSAFRNLVIYCS